MGAKNVRGRHYSLVGMSNHGKSYWGEQLAALGFIWISIDALIVREMTPTLLAEDYSLDTDGMSAWMGMPWDDRYAANQARYLELEEEFTFDAIDSLDPEVPTVVDTTGQCGASV